MRKLKIPTVNRKYSLMILIVLCLVNVVLFFLCFAFCNWYVSIIAFSLFGYAILEWDYKNKLRLLYDDLIDTKYIKLINIPIKIVIKSNISYKQDYTTSDIILAENSIIILNSRFLLQFMRRINEKRYFDPCLINDKKLTETSIQFSAIRMVGIGERVRLTLDFTGKPNEFKIVNEFDLKTEN